MYDHLPSFILGFHGCDLDLAEDVFAGRANLTPSTNKHDWLGNGMYFWENNPQRAMDWARLRKQQPLSSQARITHPAVVGAVIDLGFCLNLLDTQFIRMVRDAYSVLRDAHRKDGAAPPVNKPGRASSDLLLRHLDCAVIETLHRVREDQKLQPFDSARGVFVEGPPIYPNAGINEFNHIQVCVRDDRCIKGYFRPRQ